MFVDDYEKRANGQIILLVKPCPPLKKSGFLSSMNLINTKRRKWESKKKKVRYLCASVWMDFRYTWDVGEMNEGERNEWKGSTKFKT